MKRLIIMAIIKMCAEVILLTMIAGIVIGGIGYSRKWDTSLAYSNAFFIAGCLIMSAGALTRMAAGQEWKTFQFLPGESFRGMSGGERASFIINSSSSVRLVILGIASGILLILIAWFLAKMG